MEAAIRSCLPLVGIFSFLKNEVIFKTSSLLLEFSKLEILESFFTAEGDVKHSCLKSQDNSRNKITQQTERGGKRYLRSSRRLEEIYPLTQSREVKTILKTPTPLARFKVRLVSVPSLS